MDELGPDAARWSPAVKPATRFERAMWAALGLFLLASVATASCVLFALPFQFFGAGVVAMFGTGVGALFTRGLHEAHQLTTPAPWSAPAGSGDDWEVGEA